MPASWKTLLVSFSLLESPGKPLWSLVLSLPNCFLTPLASFLCVLIATPFLCPSQPPVLGFFKEFCY